MMSNCSCAWCQWYAEYKVQIETVPPEAKEFFEIMSHNMVEIEMDRDYYKAIVENKWPNSEKILARFRA
jgi:hypothetical protein